LQAYLNAGETQVKMHSLGPGVTSIATVLAENTATNATAQVSIAATNNQAAKTASISLIASSAAHEVDLSADLIALSANKIHITNGYCCDTNTAVPARPDTFIFELTPTLGIYRRLRTTIRRNSTSFALLHQSYGRILPDQASGTQHLFYDRTIVQSPRIINERRTTETLRLTKLGKSAKST
jgi:hypothetical protein